VRRRTYTAKSIREGAGRYWEFVKELGIWAGDQDYGVLRTITSTYHYGYITVAGIMHKLMHKGTIDGTIVIG